MMDPLAGKQVHRFHVRLSHDRWGNAAFDGRSMSAYGPEGKVLHGTICAYQIGIVSGF